MPQNEEARKERRRAYMRAYRERKRVERAEQRPWTEADDMIVRVDLLAMLEQMLIARA